MTSPGKKFSLSELQLKCLTLASYIMPISQLVNAAQKNAYSSKIFYLLAENLYVTSLLEKAKLCAERARLLNPRSEKTAKLLYEIYSKQIRRSSSVQLLTNNLFKQSKIFYSVISTLKASTNSMYTSTLTATTEIFGSRHSQHFDDLSLNLYRLMSKYRCCCNLCRLRFGSFTIAIISIIYPICVIAFIYLDLFNLINESQHKTIIISVSSIMAFQLLASILVLIGIFIDVHYLLLPFQVNCVINIIFSMGFGILLLMSADRTNIHLYPLIPIISTILVAIYIWFLVICSMTFILIRDKKYLITLPYNFNLEMGNLNKLNNHSKIKQSRTIERVNSALF